MAMFEQGLKQQVLGGGDHFTKYVGKNPVQNVIKEVATPDYNADKSDSSQSLRD